MAKASRWPDEVVRSRMLAALRNAPQADSAKVERPTSYAFSHAFTCTYMRGMASVLPWAHASASSP
jgi:hypothetical protein